MITPQASSSYTLQRNFLRQRCLFATVLVVVCTTLYGQDDHAYAVAIKLHAGGSAIVGYLHSVSDSAVIIIPGRGGKKGLEAALERPQQISLPTQLIKKLAVVRVRTTASVFLTSLLISAGYSIAYLAFVPVQTPGGLIVYFATITTATLLTMDLLYARRYKPTEPGFTIKMQEFCLVKSGIAVDGQ